MATYAIGDVQGCFVELSSLLSKIGFEPGRDTAILLGDLVNRGPDSLRVLNWARKLEDCVRVVLGNHDLHMLAVAFGVVDSKRKDTFADVISQGKDSTILHWLRNQSLLIDDGQHVYVHAGIWPGWALETAKRLSGELEHHLASSDPRSFLNSLYGNEPDIWCDTLEGERRSRFVTNVFTRMRVLSPDGRLNMDYKGVTNDVPDGAIPWFDFPRETPLNRRVVFGHWSALGLQMRQDIVSLDTGCVWGRALTGWCVETGEIVSVDSTMPPGFE
ncbi:symmetrical bis(5'-nucleosyl)-tetraphosphatase [Burkholderiaceae bacterium DAT-1]|nr:symmetrical bis(5'-nucleosyl)-tetraphosphatase [Burkholderiaceae bacterium DAT-1]